MSIQVLDNNTINKIAAGEVIENPASVVKELIENSIDANAKSIIVEIKEGGTKLIRITDNGDGFEKDDIEIAFLKHSTSKLKTIDDLNSVSSYGFRGEALSSIASVSRITLITKSKFDNTPFGYSYSMDFGDNTKFDKIASNYGTVIEIKDLFENVPVRKKFLKGNIKENTLVEDIVIKLALANEGISFKLIIDEKIKFVSNGSSDLKSIIYSLYGKEIVDSLLSIDYEHNGINVRGYVAKPIVARNTRNDEIYFINGRYVKSKIINNAIDSAYEGYLMQHKYPLAILKIKIDNKYVDVNVHPKKLEVRFSSDELVYLSVYNAILNALKDTTLIHEEKFSGSDNINVFNYIDDNYKINDDEDKEGTSVDELPSLDMNFNKKLSAGLNLRNFNNNLSKIVEETTFIQKTLSDDHKYIGQVFNTYILVEFEDKLYIIDQHAAHEKINFEKIMKSFRENDAHSQKIFPSLVLKLTPLQYEAVASNIDEFRKIGYEIEAFGDNDIKVDAVPYYIFNIGNEKLLLDMIDSFVDNKNKEHYDSIVEKIASISCKKSIKANHILSEVEVKQLLRELFKLDNPYNCPHGRPTIISLSKTEFEKRFGRIV